MHASIDSDSQIRGTRLIKASFKGLIFVGTMFLVGRVAFIVWCLHFLDVPQFIYLANVGIMFTFFLHAISHKMFHQPPALVLDSSSFFFETRLYLANCLLKSLKAVSCRAVIISCQISINCKCILLNISSKNPHTNCHPT